MPQISVIAVSTGIRIFKSCLPEYIQTVSCLEVLLTVLVFMQFVFTKKWSDCKGLMEGWWNKTDINRTAGFIFSEPLTRSRISRIQSKFRIPFLGFASPCIIIHSNECNQPDAAISRVYYLSFKYSSTCFGHPHAHHQELNNSFSNLWFTVGKWW